MEETLQQKTKGPKLFKWALWWGLGIVVVCVAILMIMGESVKDFDAPMMDVFYNMIYKFGILPVVLIIGIVAPIIEEFVFRSWGNGKLWTGTTSLILMALITLSIGWWLSLITIVCGAFILYYFRDDRKTKMFSLMILSSIMFAVAHASNYNGDGHWFMMFVSVLHKFGFGLVASYLVINYNLFWSMVLHVVNNSILALPLLISFNSINNEVKVIENDDFRVEMRTVLVEEQGAKFHSYPYKHVDENTYYGYFTGFATQSMMYDVLSHEEINLSFDTLIIASLNSEFPVCHFTLSFKKEPINYHSIHNTLVEEGLIDIDTMVTLAYKIDITDKTKLVYGQPEGLMSYKMLIMYMRHYGLPIYTDIPNNYDTYTGASFYDSLYVKDISYTNYRSDYTIDDLRKILEPQGITIEPTERKMTIIDIKNKYNPLEEL